MAEENISVCVRVRPLGERESEERFAWGSDGASIWPLSRPNTRFTIDRVFGPATTTNEIYDSDIRPLIEKVVAGINATFFAYGQTSSGKTYTIQGVEQDEGVVALAVRDVFEFIRRYEKREFLCRASYLEIYNEEINDLLCEENTRLPLHEGKDGDVYVSGLTEEIVEAPDAVMNLMRDGEDHRHTGATKMNERSSRSHTIFRMIVESRNLERGTEESDDAVWVSTLNLVDLAGSERISKTGAEGLRMKEGTAINKSLLNLGIVINQLAHKSSVVSYRDSKLTRILQRSLGGNAKTAILCNITPASCHVEESCNTLRFGCRAKKVINTAHVNEVLSDEALLKRQAKEIEQLKKRLAENGNPDIEFEISQMRAALLRSEREKELMQIKLDEEKAKKEKAERQVQVATQLMFSQEQELMLLQDRQKRRDTWCPGEVSQGSAVRRPETLPSASKELDVCTTPPSAKRHMKTRPSSRCGTEGLEATSPETRRMSTEDVRQLVRDLVEEKAELQRRLAAVVEADRQKTAHVQSLEEELRSAYKTRRGVGGGAELRRERDVLVVKLAAMKLRNQELQIEQDVAAEILKRCLSQRGKGSNGATDVRSRLESKLQELEKLKASAEATLKQREAELEKLQTRLEARERELELTSASFKEAEADLRSARQQHLSQTEQLEKELQQLKSERDEMKHAVAAKHEELSMTKKYKSRCETQATHVSKERDLQSKEAERFKRRCEEMDVKCKGLLRERVDLQSDKSTLQRQIKALERENAALKGEAMKRDAVTDKKREALQQDLHKMKEKMESMRSEGETLQSRVAQLEARLEAQQRECSELRFERGRSEEQLQRLEEARLAEKASLSAAVESSTKEVTELKRQLEHLTSVHSGTLVQLESVTSQLSKANREAERMETTARIQVSEAKEKMEFRVHELAIQQELSLAEITELRKCLEDKEDAYLQLEIGLQKMEDEKRAVEKTMELQSKAAADQQKDMSQRLEEAEKRIGDLQQTCQSTQENLHELMCGTTALEESLKLSEEDRKKLLVEVDSAQEQSREKEARAKELQTQVWSLEEKLEELSSEKRAVARSAAESADDLKEKHQQELKELQVVCDGQAKEVLDLKCQVSRLTSLRARRGQEDPAAVKKMTEEVKALKAKLVVTEGQLSEMSHQLGVVQHEAEEWKKTVSTSRNVEEWVQSLSAFIYELKFQSNQLLADFDRDENHIPTKQRTEAASQQALSDLTEKLRSAKRAEMELYGVLRVMKEDIKKAGWQPEKLEELLENSRKEYRRVYSEGKLQRLQAELETRNSVISKLERDLRALKKQLPPKRIQVDLNKPPPTDLG